MTSRGGRGGRRYRFERVLTWYDGAYGYKNRILDFGYKSSPNGIIMATSGVQSFARRLVRLLNGEEIARYHEPRIELAPRPAPSLPAHASRRSPPPRGRAK